MSTYRVVVLGPKPFQDPDQALQSLATAFSQPVLHLKPLVEQARAVVKHGARLSHATRLKSVIEAAGFECAIEPEPT